METKPVVILDHYPFVIIMDTETKWRIAEFMRYDDMDYAVFAIHPEVYTEKESAQREIRNWLYIQDSIDKGMQ